ncbi:hypothetical protein Sjap_023901 [Stephania japonica]|uniref:Uncharacterized protein n=1 Tax=Stephania japonica TaxID=461633 RepID=A0AAP0ECL3_9MAGN
MEHQITEMTENHRKTFEDLTASQERMSTELMVAIRGQRALQDPLPQMQPHIRGTDLDPILEASREEGDAGQSVMRAEIDPMVSIPEISAETLSGRGTPQEGRRRHHDTTGEGRDCYGRPHSYHHRQKVGTPLNAPTIAIKRDEEGWQEPPLLNHPNYCHRKRMKRGTKVGECLLPHLSKQGHNACPWFSQPGVSLTPDGQ